MGNASSLRWKILAIAAFSFAARACFLFATADRAWPHSALYEGDATVWVRWAAQLARGEPFEFRVPMRTPGMAYALHWLVPGALVPPFTAVKLALCALSAASCAWLFAVVRREVSERAGWIAAGLACFSFGQHQLATSLNNEAPYTLLVVALVDLSLRLVERPRLALAASAGVLHGLAILLRAEHTLVLAAFMLLIGWRLCARKRFNDLLRSALVPVAAVSTCFPWTWASHVAVERFNSVPVKPIDYAAAVPPWTSEARAHFEALPAFARGGNFEMLTQLTRQRGASEVTRADTEAFFRDQFGHVPGPLSSWTLSSTKGPLDFALANDPASRGGFSRAGLRDKHDEEPTFAFGRPSHTRLYNEGYAIGLAGIRADFSGWLALVGRKLVIFCDGATLGFTALNAPFGRATVRRAVDMATPSAPSRIVQGAMLFVFAAGAVLALRKRVASFWLVLITTKVVTCIAFYGYARQAASVAPAFFVCAAVALDALFARTNVRTPRLRSLGLALAGTAVVCELVHFAKPPVLNVAPARIGARIVPSPQWGAGAFESFDDIVLLPR